MKILECIICNEMKKPIVRWRYDDYPNDDYEDLVVCCPNCWWYENLHEFVQGQTKLLGKTYDEVLDIIHTE